MASNVAAKAVPHFKVGQRQVFFAGFPMKMIRPKPHQPRNVAVFHVPCKVNKLDIKDYLFHLYNVKATSVRTAIYPERKLTRKEKDVEYPRLFQEKLKELESAFAGREEFWVTRYAKLRKEAEENLAKQMATLRKPAYKQAWVYLAEPFQFPGEPDPNAFQHKKHELDQEREEWYQRYPSQRKDKKE